jgi:hypothetical protein
VGRRAPFLTLLVTPDGKSWRPGVRDSRGRRTPPGLFLRVHNRHHKYFRRAAGTKPRPRRLRPHRGVGWRAEGVLTASRQETRLTFQLGAFTRSSSNESAPSHYDLPSWRGRDRFHLHEPRKLLGPPPKQDDGPTLWIVSS